MKKVSALLNQAGVINPLLILLAIAGVIIFILIAQTAPFTGKQETLYPKPTAEAAGKGHRKTQGTLTVLPNPVAAGAQFTISGTGFFPNERVVVNITGQWGDFLTTDSNGAFSYTRSLQQPWTYTINAYQERNNKSVLMATTTITVQ